MSLPPSKPPPPEDVAPITNALLANPAPALPTWLDLHRQMETIGGDPRTLKVAPLTLEPQKAAGKYIRAVDKDTLRIITSTIGTDSGRKGVQVLRPGGHLEPDLASRHFEYRRSNRRASSPHC